VIDQMKTPHFKPFATKSGSLLYLISVTIHMIR